MNNCTSTHGVPDPQEILTVIKRALLGALQSLPHLISFNKQWNYWIPSPSDLFWVLSQRTVYPPTDVRTQIPGAAGDTHQLTPASVLHNQLQLSLLPNGTASVLCSLAWSGK